MSPRLLTLATTTTRPSAYSALPAPFPDHDPVPPLPGDA